MRQTSGFALIAALLVMVAVLILVFGTAFTSMIDRMVSANQRGSTDAYYVAKAGLDKYKTVAFQAFRYYLEHIKDYQDDLASGNPACGNFLSIGLDLDRNGSLNDAGVDLRSGDSTGNIAEGNGFYNVTFAVAGRYIILTSVGTVGRSRSTLQLVAEPRNAGVLSYAIFAGGGGFGNKKINGNAKVYGGVYVEGSGSTSEPVIDANGGFGMHNYYTENTLRSLISWPNNRTVGPADFLKLSALEQRDLCAHLRVKNGYVDLSGNMTVGDASAPNGFKAKVAGVHVGQSGSNTEIRTSGNSQLHTDIRGGFDLGEEGIPFPTLDSTNCKDDENRTLRQCLNDMASFTLNADVVPTNGTCAADLAKPDITTIQGSTQQKTIVFGSGSAQGNNYIAGSADINCLEVNPQGEVIGGFSYTYNPATYKGTLEVIGVVNLKGYDLRFAQNVDVRFSEKATFFVERHATGNRNGGNVTVDGDILPSNRFPDTDVLGIVAERRFHVTGRNQQRLETNGQAVAGVFYAGERAVVEGGTLFGSVVSPEFCTSENNSNPPGCRAGGSAAVVHVPGLEYNLAPGFDAIPSSAVPTFRIASFERR